MVCKIMCGRWYMTKLYAKDGIIKMWEENGGGGGGMNAKTIT